MVDAHVSGACSERSAGSSPVPGTKIRRPKRSSFFLPVIVLLSYRLTAFAVAFGTSMLVSRKKGYQKPDEVLQEEYAEVIKQLRKGYPIRMIAKSEGVGVSTVQRMKKKVCGCCIRKEDNMGYTKLKSDYLIEYKNEIGLLSDEFSLRQDETRLGESSAHN